jgi:hypothetical protein
VSAVTSASGFAFIPAQLSDAFARPGAGAPCPGSRSLDGPDQLGVSTDGSLWPDPRRARHEEASELRRAPAVAHPELLRLRRILADHGVETSSEENARPQDRGGGLSSRSRAMQN